MLFVEDIGDFFFLFNPIIIVWEEGFKPWTSPLKILEGVS